MPTQVVPAPNSKADGLPEVQESVLGETEEWRAVDGWPYEVSNMGRVRRSQRGPRTSVGRVLRFNPDRKGYLRVRLCRNGKPRVHKVYHLVLNAFCEERPVGLQANHKDGDKTNNRPENLEWVTGLQNVHHAMKMGLSKPPPPGEQHQRAKLTTAIVQEIRSLGWQPVQERRAIAKRFGVVTHTIEDILRRRSWRHV